MSVKANIIPSVEQGSPPGSIAIKTSRASVGMGPTKDVPTSVSVACPGCGKVAEGPIEALPIDPKNLTLAQTVGFQCCGWSGKLTDGQFVKDAS
jgi:hypothetical protein